MARLRKKHRISCEGDDVPDPLFSFQSMAKTLKFSHSFMQSVKTSGYKQPTPV